MEEIGIESNTQGTGRPVKSFFIGMSVVFLGPVGLLFIWLWRRDWLQRRSLAIAAIAWSVFYIIGAMNSHREEAPITAVSASEVDETPEESPTDMSKMPDSEEGKEESSEDADLEETTEPSPSAVEVGYDSPPTQTTPNSVTYIAPDGENSNSSDVVHEDPTEECIIKGNVSSKGEKIYHTPSSRSYNRTKINPEEGDQLFCTIEEAVAAGFRAAED